MTRVTLSEPVEVAKFFKNRRKEVIVVSLSTYEGHNVIIFSGIVITAAPPRGHAGQASGGEHDATAGRPGPRGSKISRRRFREARLLWISHARSGTTLLAFPFTSRIRCSAHRSSA
jgi:hypothetical protein